MYLWFSLSLSHLLDMIWYHHSSSLIQLLALHFHSWLEKNTTTPLQIHNYNPNVPLRLPGIIPHFHSPFIFLLSWSKHFLSSNPYIPFLHPYSCLINILTSVKNFQILTIPITCTPVYSAFPPVDTSDPSMLLYKAYLSSRTIRFHPLLLTQRRGFSNPSPPHIPLSIINAVLSVGSFPSNMPDFSHIKTKQKSSWLYFPNSYHPISLFPFVAKLKRVVYTQYY